MDIILELANDDKILLCCALHPLPFTLGQHETCDVCIPYPDVAPLHVLIAWTHGRLRLVNQAPQGTLVNDQRVEQESWLAQGDKIQLGPVWATVRFRDSATALETLTQTLKHPLPFQPSPLIVSLSQRASSVTWFLKEQGLSVGTHPSNDIVLDDPYVSAFHARLFMDQGRCMIQDLGSRNALFIGSLKSRESEVPLGTPIRLGQTTLCVHAAPCMAEPPDSSGSSTGLIGSSQTMQKVRSWLERVASFDVPVLLMGETGTGKEVAAHMLVHHSRRRHRPFIPLNCGALGRHLIASELFGHERGAFTGAVARKAGAFEAAHGGTLFLDEIGELPWELQPQLLRVLESSEVRRVGATQPFAVNVRVMAATHRNLAQQVAEGHFRADLFHRLHVLALEMPALRAHLEDLPELVEHFIQGYAPVGSHLTLSPAALDKLAAHPWPGNIRELRNVLQRAVLMRSAERIEAHDICFAPVPESLSQRSDQTPSADQDLSLEAIKCKALVSALQRHQGNRKAAADELELSRATVHRRIQSWGIDIPARARDAMGRNALGRNSIEWKPPEES